MSNVVRIEYEKPNLPAPTVQQNMASMVVIDDQDTYDFANGLLVEIKSGWSTWDAQRKTIVDPIMASHRATQALFNPVLDDFLAAEKIVKQKMLDYSREQEKKRISAQADADKAVREERERLEAEAARLAAAGKPEEAEAIKAVAEVTAAPMVASTFTKARGTSTVRKWKARVTDKAKLIAFIAANPKYADLLDVNQQKLDMIAKAMEARIDIDGVEAYQDETLSARRAA